jgi:Zn-dependent protease with chaperone function
MTGILVPALMAGVKTGRVRDSVKLEYPDAPDLWDMVTGLAKDRVIRPPAELRIIAEANAMVTEECRFLGIVPGTRRLYVGLPLLLGLSTGEMRAVICHELGHYARGHTRVGHVVYRGAAAILEVARKFQPSQRPQFSAAAGLLAVPFLLYACLYLEMTAALRRQQEKEADRAAMEAAGKAALAGALQGTYALSLAWGYFLSRHATGAVMARLAPTGHP